MIVDFFQQAPPVPNGAPGWLGVLNVVVDGFSIIFVSVISLLLAVCFTTIYVMFSGVRYRIFTDRIEYQHGKRPKLGPVQILSFGELESICWKIDGDSSWNVFIDFHFASRPFQLHKGFDLSGQVAEACRMIERDMIAPKILRLLAEGKTVTFKCPDHEIYVDDESIRDENFKRLAWDKVNTIRFSKGWASQYGDFLAQSHICMETSERKIEFDMASHNPHALWAVIMDRCSLPTVQVLNFPTGEKPLS